MREQNVSRLEALFALFALLLFASPLLFAAYALLKLLQRLFAG